MRICFNVIPERPGIKGTFLPVQDIRSLLLTKRDASLRQGGKRNGAALNFERKRFFFILHLSGSEGRKYAFRGIPFSLRSPSTPPSSTEIDGDLSRTNPRGSPPPAACSAETGFSTEKRESGLLICETELSCPLRQGIAETTGMTLREIGENLEQYFIEIIREKRHQPIDVLANGILFFASRMYRRAVQFRIWLYENRVIRNRAIGCLVVSIGNLTCGGTGKTPVVEVFAKTLSQKGRRVAVLSRGYRSRDRSLLDKLRKKFSSKKMEVPPRVVSDGKNLLLNSMSAGDEPFMLASNLKNVVVLVDKDRVKSGLYAIEEFRTDTLILDDGFQYLNLKAHINILLVDTTSPFDNHHVLPRGLLREPVKNIRRADYVFLTKSDGSSRLRHLKNFIRRHNHRAEIIECCHKPRYLEDVFDRGTRFPLSDLRGKRVASISAIANPASFNAFLTELGSELVLERHYADHHRYRQQEMIDFINDAKAAGAELIMTTEKDAVRMPRLDRRDLPILFLRVEIDILSGQESFDQCISRICFI